MAEIIEETAYERKLRRNREYRALNRERISAQRKDYYQRNKDAIKQRVKDYYERTFEERAEGNRERQRQNWQKRKPKRQAYYQENIERFHERGRQYYQENRDKLNSASKQYHSEHRDELVAKQHERQAHRLVARQICPAFRFLNKLRLADITLYTTQYKPNSDLVNKAYPHCRALKTGDWTKCPAFKATPSAIKKCPMPKVFEFANAVEEIKQHAFDIMVEQVK